MESAPVDVSPAPSTRGFKGVLSKARRGGKDNSSTPSINGTETSSEANGIRSSIESSQENSRAGRQSLEDGASISKPRKLSKMILGRLRRKKPSQDGVGDQQGEEEEEEEADEVDDDRRGRSISEVATTSITLQPTTNSRSQSLQDGDGGSSPIPHATDDELLLGSPPPLQNHPYHSGYPASSSPLIRVSNIVDTPNFSQPDNFSAQQSSAARSTTLPISNTKDSESIDLAPRHAASIDSRQSEQSLGASEAISSKNRRGISPGTKIRNVFSSGSRKADASPPADPDGASVKSSGGGNTSGGLFTTGEKRNSINLQKGSRLSKAMPQPTTSGTQNPNSSERNLSSLSITPKTPPSATLDAPLTTVTPPTPTDQQVGPSRFPSPKPQSSFTAGANPNIVTSASGNMISHRRVRSDSATHQPSRLSNSVPTPLTPTIEESVTPGARSPLSQGSTGGFFSSVFSMAQNATSTLTSSLATTNPSRPRSLTLTVDEDSSNRGVETSSSTTEGSEKPPVEAKKKLAIDTLGTGDLSLSHLGIASDTPLTANSSTSVISTVADELSQRPKVITPLQRDEIAARTEDTLAARATSAAHSEKTPAEKYFAPAADEPAPSIAGEKTPPNGSVFEGDQGTRRSGSVRSRVGAVTRRHRNSSSATGNTVGTLGTFNGASQASLGNTHPSTNGPKPTGFAVASKKRNRDFHQLFRSIPEDDYLIEDYSCALQREIILAGRMYVSESHICFSSNILGWVTTLIISFDEIVSVEKENTAMVFPNAIAIQTLHARQTFRSLLSREATYELIIGIWKLSHPSLKSSLNGVRLDFDGTGDKTEKVDVAGDDPSDVSEEEEDVYDEDEDEGEDEGLGSFTEAGDVSVEGSEENDSSYRSVTRKASAMGVAIGAAAGGIPTSGDGKAGEKATVVANVDFPGPSAHAPTECSDGDTHYEKVVKDDIIPAPLGKVYSMMFGPASGGFMTRWFVDEQRMIDLQMEDDKKGLSEENRSRSYSYIKPLYASIGPKQTKCLITETLDSIDLEKAVSVTVVTQTPDVPSGSVFSTKTKFCLTWASGNSTRLFVNCTIEWTGKSWLKGPIEKGANDGQATYATDLVKALKAGVLSRPRTGTNSSRVRVKGKRRKGDMETPTKSISRNPPNEPKVQQPIKTWGFLEPLHGPLGPLFDIFSSIISANIIIGILTFLLLVTWLRIPSRSSKGAVGFPQISTPERIAAYEEIWRREEHSLWDWLEERIGMEGIAYPTSSLDSDQEALKKARRQREQSLKLRAINEKLAEKNMSEREIDDAILVAEEKLEVLRKALRKKRYGDTK